MGLADTTGFRRRALGHEENSKPDGPEKYVYRFDEGDRSMADLLGGKGANLAEMSRLGLPVPPGFTITTAACRASFGAEQWPTGLDDQIQAALSEVESRLGKSFGAPHDPLLVSVRSGARFSMPGMMETVLNVGLNDASVAGLVAVSGDERFAWDSYRRLIQMFGSTVMGVPSAEFQRLIAETVGAAGVELDTQLSASWLRELVERFKHLVHTRTGLEFPQDTTAQLHRSIAAVFSSWNTDRAIVYRRQEHLPSDEGTAVNVQAMVFGNGGPGSASGVAFTRDPATGDSGVYGDYLPNAQGEDVVSGVRDALPLSDLAVTDPDSYQQLRKFMARLERHYRDLCDIEFTIERGRLWMLQTRVGKRTAEAAFRIAVDLVDEGIIDMDEALSRVSGRQLSQLMFPTFDESQPSTTIARGIAASPGAAVGEVQFTARAAVDAARDGRRVILVRRETAPDDLEGMVASVGVLTSRGGKTSHAAVVARGMGMTAVCGADDLEVDTVRGIMTARESTRIRAGDTISIDGSTGEVFLGAREVTSGPVMRYFESGADSAIRGLDHHSQALVRAVDRLMSWADKTRRLGVRANADTPADAQRARRMGAEGIGLLRTEHMFLGDRTSHIVDLVLAETEEKQDKALAALLPVQRNDFVSILEAMDGLPVTIRLMDPPLHEFLPNVTELSVRAATRPDDAAAAQLLAAVGRLSEDNPMLGTRGVRLGLVIPGLYELQVRAIAEAACIRLEAGGDPRPRVMVPLVADARELELVRDMSESVIEEVAHERGCALDLEIGTMIELPRAALTADHVAAEADFFSFGTNDLTQTTWGFSRDDVEGSFFPLYFERGVFATSPFESIDESGVGELIQLAVTRGRLAKPDLECGICGEHGGDPASIHFCHRIGLDYVSCSPFRIPVARLEAARAALAAQLHDATA